MSGKVRITSFSIGPPLKTRDGTYVDRPGQSKVGQSGIEVPVELQVVLVDAVAQNAPRMHDGYSIHCQGEDDRSKFWFSR